MTEWLWARLFLPPLPSQLPSLPFKWLGVWWRIPSANPHLNMLTWVSPGPGHRRGDGDAEKEVAYLRYTASGEF